MTNTSLYKLSNTSLLIWTATVENNILTIQHGQESGNLQTETLSFDSNSNAVTDLHRRARIKEERQGYSETVPTTAPQLPMLLSTYNAGKLPELLYIQPKWDGIRCISTNCTMVTRRQEPITVLPHITQELTRLPPGIRLDGELHCPGINFQQHLSLIKRQDLHLDCLKIKYYVFDMQIEDIPYTERYAKLVQLFDTYKFSQLVLTPTELIYKHQLVEAMKQNYSNIEGGVIRNPQSMYEYNKRPVDFQKYKWSDTSECKIVDIIAAAKGREEGAAIFVCELNGVQFKARPKIDLYLRKAIYQHRKSVIGQYTRITYEGLSNLGKPLKPRAEGYYIEPIDS